MDSFPAPTRVNSIARGSRFPFALQRPHGAKIEVAKRMQKGQAECVKVGLGEGPMRLEGNFYKKNIQKS